MTILRVGSTFAVATSEIAIFSSTSLWAIFRLLDGFFRFWFDEIFLTALFSRIFSFTETARAQVEFALFCRKPKVAWFSFILLRYENQNKQVRER